MKKISMAKIKKVLKELESDEATRELILNNVMLYNDRVEEYENCEDKSKAKNLYLTYQLNVQISKQIEGLKRIRPKVKEDEDPLKKLLNDLKKPRNQLELDLFNK